MSRDRTFLTFILALAGLAAFAAARPSSPDPVDDVRTSETWFYINKTHQAARYDAVVVGDSRALRGVSPAAMQEDLDVGRICNFAFSACGLDRAIYAEAEELLDPASPSPFIVLAPTALSFQSWKRANLQYREYKNKPRDQVWQHLHLPRLTGWFQPVAPSIYLRRALNMQPATRLEQVFHADGWIESIQTPFDDLTDLTVHRERLKGNSVDAEMISEFMEQTGEWTRRGIRVFAFYHPAQPERVAMEDSMLGFDRQSFSEAFVAAGGIWLEMDGDGLQTYDGSHLVAESAVRMSHKLADGIRRHW